MLRNELSDILEDTELYHHQKTKSSLRVKSSTKSIYVKLVKPLLT